MSALTEGLASIAEGIPEVGGVLEDGHAAVNGVEMVGNLLTGNFQNAAADGVAGVIRAVGGTVDLGDGPLGMIVGPATELLAQGAHNLIAKKEGASQDGGSEKPSFLKEVAGTAVKAGLADIPVVGRVFQGIEAVDTLGHGVSELFHGNFARGGADLLKTYIRGKAAISGQGAVQAELICGAINVAEDRLPFLQEKGKTPAATQSTPNQTAGQNRYGNAPFNMPPMQTRGDLFKDIPLAGDALAQTA